VNLNGGLIPNQVAPHSSTFHSAVPCGKLNCYQLGAAMTKRASWDISGRIPCNQLCRQLLNLVCQVLRELELQAFPHRSIDRPTFSPDTLITLTIKDILGAVVARYKVSKIPRVRSLHTTSHCTFLPGGQALVKVELDRCLVPACFLPTSILFEVEGVGP
jgi:hypothetical protein